MHLFRKCDWPALEDRKWRGRQSNPWVTAVSSWLPSAFGVLVVSRRSAH
ncbi:hypothetical protein [Kibdelosporangium philippinense]